jgi:hypothetical protein
VPNSPHPVRARSSAFPPGCTARPFDVHYGGQFELDAVRTRSIKCVSYPPLLERRNRHDIPVTNGAARNTPDPRFDLYGIPVHVSGHREEMSFG